MPMLRGRGEHLSSLVEGEVVREVWLHFANVFGLQLCETGDLVNLRNAAKYHGAHFTATGTILEVQRHLRTLYAARIMTSIQWKGDLHRALAMGFCFRPIAPQAPRVVRWSTPLRHGSNLIRMGHRSEIPGRQQRQALFGMQMDRCVWHTSLLWAQPLVWSQSLLLSGEVLELARAHSLAPIVVEVDATVVLQLLQSRDLGYG
ncbi:UNVERIFIED_CONTAM: hypothetical protein Sindi_3066500, partial [Sesamum indicum]